MVVSLQLIERLSHNEREAIESFLARLWAQYPERIFQAILFGSKSRGDSHPESDIDVLLIADQDEWRFQHAISDIASDVSLEYSVLIGPRVISQARWAKMTQEHFGLCENVEREGIPLTLEPVPSHTERSQATAA